MLRKHHKLVNEGGGRKLSWLPIYRNYKYMNFPLSIFLWATNKNKKVCYEITNILP